MRQQLSKTEHLPATVRLRPRVWRCRAQSRAGAGVMSSGRSGSNSVTPATDSTSAGSMPGSGWAASAACTRSATTCAWSRPVAGNRASKLLAPSAPAHRPHGRRRGWGTNKLQGLVAHRVAVHVVHARSGPGPSSAGRLACGPAAVAPFLAQAVGERAAVGQASQHIGVGQHVHLVAGRLRSTSIWPWRSLARLSSSSRITWRARALSRSCTLADSSRGGGPARTACPAQNHRA